MREESLEDIEDGGEEDRIIREEEGSQYSGREEEQEETERCMHGERVRVNNIVN